MINNYYISSFLWSTIAKILNAIWGFFSIPLLLGLYGKSDYGILSIAIACNGYMALLDLGMNTGAVKYFSQWKVEQKHELLSRVIRTNMTFYLLISLLNILGLMALAFWGEGLFSVTHAQFYQLRVCLLIIAFFSIFSWGATSFNQLLIANGEMPFIMKTQCLQVLLKTVLVFLVLFVHLPLFVYFFFLTAIMASLIIPYTIKCRMGCLIDSLKPALYWNDFKIVFTFSLSIFTLSLFQVTAVQSRPLLLSLFAPNAVSIVADFRILEVFPAFIITLGGTFSGIFLPKVSEMVTKGNMRDIHTFAYKWTTWTSVLANVLCVPFMLSSKEILSAYVGSEYVALSGWLVLWCVTALIQIHTTPGNSIVLAYGKTRLLVVTTGVSCVLSMVINVLLCKVYGVGSAVIGYFVYVVIVIGLYYLVYYKILMGFNRWRMMRCFMVPTFISVILFFMVYSLNINVSLFNDLSTERLSYLAVIMLKTTAWFVPYVLCLLLFKIVDIKNIKNK